MQPVYVIRDWRALYEKDRNRACAKMLWVANPIGFRGEGYRTVIKGPNGPAVYGAWTLLKLVAAECDPRGALIETSGDPHTAQSIADITLLHSELVAECIQVVSSQKVGWLVLCSSPEEIESTLGTYRGDVNAAGVDSRRGRERTHGADVNAAGVDSRLINAPTLTSTGTDNPPPYPPLASKGVEPSDSQPGAVRKTKKQARAERKQAEIDDAVEFANRRVKR